MPPFEEAIAYFRRKLGHILTRAEFDQLEAAEKTRAFTAARVVVADQLQALYGSLLGIISSGGTLSDFQEVAQPLLTEPWHLNLVFQQNVASAYGAGHLEQARQARDMRPYGRYIAGANPRPSHEALHGLVYPLDHPFWEAHWPPWDYNCNCLVETLSPAEVEAEGLSISYTMPRNVAPSENFAGPGRGGDWQPDYNRYAPELGKLVKKEVGTLRDALKEWLTELVTSKNTGGPAPTNRLYVGTIGRRSVRQEHPRRRAELVFKGDVGRIQQFPAPKGEQL